MKKIIILVLLLIGSFTLVNADADSEIVSKVKTVDITKLQNDNEYMSYRLMDTTTNWENDYIYYDYSYYTGNDFLMSAIASVDKVNASKYMDKVYDRIIPFEDELFSYYTFRVADDENTMENESAFYGLYVDILDKDLNLKKHIQFSERFFCDDFYLNIYNIYIVESKDGGYLIGSDGYSNNAGDDLCSLAQIDKDYNVTALDCTIDRLKELFPDYAYEEDNNLNDVLYDKLDNKLVYLKDDKLFYLEDDKEIFNIEINDETKIQEFKLMNDYLIAINYSTIDNENDFGGGNYISELSVYDKDGKLVQNFKDNSAFVGLDVNNETNRFVVLKKYVDGICNSSYAGNLSCETEMKYDVYQVKGATTIVDEEIVDNPDTHDLIIITFGVLIIGSLGFIIFRKKLEY